MSNYPLFYMSSFSREYFIEKHRFYIEQSNDRLLSQFEHLEQDAASYAEEWLNKRSQNFNPDRADPGSLQEQAYEESISFYLMLDEMKKNTQLSVVAGMFHAWDKDLRDWLVNEICRWHQGENVRSAVWKASFDDIIDFLESLDWRVKSEPFYSTLDGCRWVVNAYKHGDGLAFSKIKTNFPQFLDEFCKDVIGFANHTNLCITKEHIAAFAETIVSFWEFIPERTFANDSMIIPNWLEKAFNKDNPRTYAAYVA